APRAEAEVVQGLRRGLEIAPVVQEGVGPELAVSAARLEGVGAAGEDLQQLPPVRLAEANARGRAPPPVLVGPAPAPLLPLRSFPLASSSFQPVRLFSHSHPRALKSSPGLTPVVNLAPVAVPLNVPPLTCSSSTGRRSKARAHRQRISRSAGAMSCSCES